MFADIVWCFILGLVLCSGVWEAKTKAPNCILLQLMGVLYIKVMLQIPVLGNWFSVIEVMNPWHSCVYDYIYIQYYCEQPLCTGKM